MTEIEHALRASAPPPDDPPALDLAAAEDAGLIDISYTRHDSPVGTLLLAATARGLLTVRYLDGDRDEELALAKLAVALSPRILAAPRRLERPRRELEEFFAGSRRQFELALDRRLIGGGFAGRVLSATGRIPYGAVSSYGEVAAGAGSPRAFRAAGTALAGNPLPIVIPCHRVLRSGGGLGGYTGGLQRKRVLLTIECGA